MADATHLTQLLCQVLKWDDKALFGLIRSEMRWQLRRDGGGARTLWTRKPKTIVSLGIETSGYIHNTRVSFKVQQSQCYNAEWPLWCNLFGRFSVKHCRAVWLPSGQQAARVVYKPMVG